MASFVIFNNFRIWAQIEFLSIESSESVVGNSYFGHRLRGDFGMRWDPLAIHQGT